jgi:outer membrane lipoprotein carrier protein
VRSLLTCLIVLVVAAGAHPLAQPPDPVALAQRIQQRYARLTDYSGDFTQSYEGGVLRTRTTERGTFAIRQPNQFRFVYDAPERKEFVSDGISIFSYLIADRQVIVTPMPTAGQATTPVLVLAGRADLARDFTPTFTTLPEASAGFTALRLVPKQQDPDYEWFALAVEPQSLQIRVLVAADRQGGRSVFSFTNVKENRRLPDNTFRFRVPRGVDVIHHVAPPA